MRIAVLDLGSTTFHLQHVELGEGTFHCTLDEKLTLRLGDQVFPKGHFDAATRACVVNSVADLLTRSAAQRPDRTVVVATSPFRSADNGAALASELGQRFGVDVIILTAQREAEFAYLGNATFDHVDGLRTAVVDIGGGSAEVAVGEGARCMHALSLPLGAVRMGRLVASRRPFGQPEAGVLLDALRDAVDEPLREVRALRPSALVFASGTARAVIRDVMEANTETPGVGKYSYVFPGQGSQSVGMGRELYNASPAAREDFEEADDSLNFHLSRLIFEGPTEELQDTINSQPAIMVVSIACWRAWQEFLGARAPRPASAAGHSLGEYTSLVEFIYGA
jgi:hypothetical protein